MSDGDAGRGFGTNSWLVEEMYEKYRADPASVGDAWREFFSDFRSAEPAPHLAPVPPAAAEAAAPAPPAAPAGQPAPAAAPVPAVEVGDPIRGAGAAIVANMERSLAVPTATSFRNVPAKLLEVNR